MNAEDAIGNFERLAQILRESSLAWIVSQVEDDIRTGRTEQKDAPVPSDPRRGRAETRASDAPSRARQEEFTALRDYTPVERLELLIDATERAVRGSAELESALLRLGPFRETVEIVLAREGDAGGVRSLNANAGTERLNAMQRLGKALGALRAEARDAH
jgi:hypothetical protein